MALRFTSVPRLGTAAAALVLATTLLSATNGTRVSFVPWKVLERGDDPRAALLILYWIPASPEELRRSELVTSSVLLGYAARCVAMQVIRVDDGERIDRLGVTGQLPTALLADEEGQVLDRVESQNGALRSADVERMVHDAVERREAAAESLLDQARQELAAGDHAAAELMYGHVAAQRCAFPRLAKKAQRALRKMNGR